MAVIYKLDVVEGRLQLKGGGNKAPGGNVKLKAGRAGNVRWELPPNSSLDSFDITFETTVFGSGASDPAPAYPWPFTVQDRNQDAKEFPATATMKGCKFLEVEFNGPASSFKYTITARVPAVLDPIIILE